MNLTGSRFKLMVAASLVGLALLAGSLLLLRESAGWVDLPNTYYRAGGSAREKLRNVLAKLERNRTALAEAGVQIDRNFLASLKALFRSYLNAPNDPSTNIQSVAIHRLPDAERDPKKPREGWAFRVDLPAEVIVVDRELGQFKAGGLALDVEVLDDLGTVLAHTNAPIDFGNFKDIDLFLESPAYAKGRYLRIEAGSEIAAITFAGVATAAEHSIERAKAARVRILWSDW